MMTKPPLDEWVNALQLSIKTSLEDTSWGDLDTLHLHFTTPPKEDSQLDDFVKLVSGKWSPNRRSLTIANGSRLPFESLTNFLLLTRLQRPLMEKLAEHDPKYLPFLDKLGLAKFPADSSQTIGTLQEAAAFVFSCVAEQKMTLRELAEATGLTQVSLSRFKGGQDIKLSNFLKILHVLGKRVLIQR